jgi:Mor family transcriptional regulator
MANIKERRNSNNATGLDGVLAEIAEVIGHDKAKALAESFAGTDIYIPHGMAGSGKIIEVVGAESFRGLASRFGGESLYIPMLKQRHLETRNAVIIEELKTLSVLQVSRQHNMTVRNVRVIAKNAKTRP